MIIGDIKVGKTSFMRQTFDEPTKVSVGLDCGTTHCFVQGEDVTLKVWDTAGEERYQSIPTSFYKNSDGIILMYDCTMKESMTNLDKWW